MDSFELLGKIKNGEITSLDQLKQIILENTSKKQLNRIKNCLKYAETKMQQDGKTDLNDFLVYFDSAKNPDQAFADD